MVRKCIGTKELNENHFICKNCPFFKQCKKEFILNKHYKRG